MEYNKLLNEISTKLEKVDIKQVKEQANKNQEEDTASLLNKIGLEIQRQGGY